MRVYQPLTPVTAPMPVSLRHQLRPRAFALLTIAALSGSACARSRSDDPSHSADAKAASARSTVERFRLSDDELRALEARANAGDNRAAYRLSEHFLMGVNQPNQALYWLQLAASRDDLPSQLAFGSLLHIYGNDRDAQVWARRAMQRATSVGDERNRAAALELLAEIEHPHSSGTARE